MTSGTDQEQVSSMSISLIKMIEPARLAAGITAGRAAKFLRDHLLAHISEFRDEFEYILACLVHAPAPFTHSFGEIKPVILSSVHMTSRPGGQCCRP